MTVTQPREAQSPCLSKRVPRGSPQSVIRWETGGLLGVQSENSQTVRQRSEDPLGGWWLTDLKSV